MAANEQGNKSEKPTQHKLRQSRENGQVAQSKDFTTFFAIATVIVGLFFFFTSYAKDITNSYVLIFTEIANLSFDNHAIRQLSIQIAFAIAKPFMFIIILATLLSTLINMAQVNGIVFSKKFMELKFESLNPVDNFKNIFSKKNLLKFVAQFGCVIIFCTISTWLICRQFDNLLKLWNLPLSENFIYMIIIIALICTTLLFVYFIYATIELVIEKRNHYKELMMSHDEIKNELKDTEGNPEIKQERKKQYQEQQEDDRLKEIMNNATFVLTNPTHIAIVILFKPLRSHLPYVLAKAHNNRAKDIINLAYKFNIPVLQDIPLARKLYPLVQMGKPIVNTYLQDLIQLIGHNLNQLPELYSELQIKFNSTLKV